MNIEEQQYLDLLGKIISSGSPKEDRTGVGTLSLFGTNMRFSLKDNTLPLLTTKKMHLKSIIEELLFFIRGETNTKLLEEKGVNIWKGNTSREFLDKRGLTEYAEGEMGPMYGYLWRNFNGVDQLAEVVRLIKEEPKSRRIMVTAYDPSLLSKSVLAPCHTLIQFNVDSDWLDCLFFARSQDTLLGTPYNICSYALLTHLIAKITNKKPRDLIFSGGDTHLYLNHIEQAKEQISRTPFSFPKINIKKEISTLEDIQSLTFEDFELIGYECWPAIKAEMAV